MTAVSAFFAPFSAYVYEMVPTAFTKTLRAIEGSHSRAALFRLFVCLTLLAALSYWLVRVPVTLYETSPDARLEINTSAATVQAPFVGTVTQADLALGRRVKAGDVLVRMDSQPEQLQVREEQARMIAIQPEIDALKQQIEAEEASGAAEQRASQSAIDEAEMKVREAETPARLAKLERERYEALNRDNLTAKRDVERAIADAERLSGSVLTARAATARLANEQKARDRQRGVRIAEIQTQIIKLETGRINVDASIRRVSYDVERRVIRAPVSGIIGDAAVLRPGSVLQEGTRVASIVAPGQLRIVAFFPPRAAYGRLKSGAPARLRLKGYPWTEFGVVEARVAEVAAEDRDGRARVELDVLPSPTLKIGLRHGMPGELEVEVERTPPWGLVLRMAGQWLTVGGAQ